MFDINSKIGKVVNGVVMTPTENEKKKIIVANADDEMLKSVLKYMDMQVEAPPEYDPEKQYLKTEHEIVEEELVVKKPVLKIRYVIKDFLEKEMTEGDVE